MSAQQDLDAAKKALADPKVRSYQYKGKTYTLTQLKGLIRELEAQVRAELSAEKEAESAIAVGKTELRTAESRLADAQESLVRDRNAFVKGRITETELNKTQARVDELQRTVDGLMGKTPAPTPTPTVSATNIPGPAVRLAHQPINSSLKG